MEQKRDHKGRFVTKQCVNAHDFCYECIECPYCEYSNKALKEEARGKN